MNNKKKMLLAVTSAILLSGGLTNSPAFAQDSATPDGLASKIASKYNLNKSDVQAVFNQHKYNSQPRKP